MIRKKTAKVGRGTVGKASDSIDGEGGFILRNVTGRVHLLAVDGQGSRLDRAPSGREGIFLFLLPLPLPALFSWILASNHLQIWFHGFDGTYDWGDIWISL